MSSESCCCHAGKRSQAEDNKSSFAFRVLSFVGLILIGIYRSVFTAHLGAGVCRFEPSCSAYANEAFIKYPFLTAFKLTFNRLIKCRPGSSFGYDPVPQLNPLFIPMEKIHELK